MFKGLEHTAIASPNPEALAGWYVEKLDFRINHAYSGNFFVRAKDGSMLEIIPSEGARLDTNMKTPGIRHLAVEVDDFDAAYAELQRRTVNFTGEPFVLSGNRLVFFTDLDGNLVHLIKRPQPLP